MEWYQRGIINSKDTDGLVLEWGNPDVIIELVHRIAFRRGDFARLLGEGPLKAAKVIGKGAEYYVVQSKGLDYENCDRRDFKGSALNHATSTRGGDHMRGVPIIEHGAGIRSPIKEEKVIELFGSLKATDARSYEGKPRAVVWYERMCTLADALELCKFAYARYPGTKILPEDMADLFNEATGWDISVMT